MGRTRCRISIAWTFLCVSMGALAVSIIDPGYAGQVWGTSGTFFSSLIPGANATYNVGSAANAVQNAYIANCIYTNDGVIALGGIGGASNNETIKLDFETTENVVKVTFPTAGVGQFWFNDIALKLNRTGLAHGMTNHTQTNNYVHLTYNSDNYGGFALAGYSSQAATAGAVIVGNIYSSPTVAPVKIVGRKSAGGSGTVTDLAATEKLLTITNNATDQMNIMGNGELNGSTISAQMNDIVTGTILDCLTAPKLIVNWKGTAAANSTESDWSGNTNTATYKGTTTADIIYKGFCKVFDPDGTDDYLSIADSDTLSFNDAAGGAVSMGGWVYVANGTGTQQIISKWVATSGAEAREWQLTLASDETVRFYIYDESADKFAYVTTDAGLAVGWHFIVVTYDGTGGANALTGANYVCYVDGVAVADTPTNDADYVAQENLTGVVTISGRNGASAYENLFLGDMGVLFVSGEELSAATIWKMYVRTKGYYNS